MRKPLFQNLKLQNTFYLLAISKAEFFLQFGFSQEKWETLADALRQHASQNEIVKTERSDFGIKYVIEGILPSPDGRNPVVRSIWFIKNDTKEPYFVTAYPLKGKTK